MITEIVEFDLPEGMTRDQASTLFETSVPRWQANRKLVTFILDEPVGDKIKEISARL